MAEHTSPKPEKPLSVYQILSVMIEQMSSVAWQKLGLQPDPFTEKIEQDLVEAKVAIDAAIELSHFLDSQLEEDDKRTIQTLLRDLKLNYVEQSQRVSA